MLVESPREKFQKSIKLHAAQNSVSIDPDDGPVLDRGSAATDGLIEDNYGVPCGCRHRGRGFSGHTNELENKLREVPHAILIHQFLEVWKVSAALTGADLRACGFLCKKTQKQKKQQL